jgi:hypothetical protein
MNNKGISRRDLLKILAAVTAVGGFSLARFFLSQIEIEGQAQSNQDKNTYIPLIQKQDPPTATVTPTKTATSTPTKTATVTKSPTPTNTTIPSTNGPRVIRVHSGSATSWTGQSSYWNYVNQDKITEMVNSGLMNLTKTGNVSDAWHAILPNYTNGQKVAIKVSFNNSENCTSGNAIDGIIEPVNALINGMVARGVSVGNIYVYDAMRALPTRFTSKGVSGVHYVSIGSCSGTDLATWSETNVAFHPPSGSVASETLAQVLIDATYVINMPIMKRHPIGGVSLGYKNHFGSINDPGGLHTWIDVVNGTARSDYNPLVDIYANANVGAKTVLTVGDGIFSTHEFNQAPVAWTIFNNETPKSLFFSQDPVAIDCVMHDFVRLEMQAISDPITSSANRYLQLAEAKGQGVFESISNPLTGSYSKIDYVKVELS